MRESLHFAKKVCGKRPAIGVEVGVQFGKNANDILTYWEDLHKLYLVEIDPSLKDGILDRLKEFDGRFELIIKDSIDAASLFKDHSLDFVYIDANHDYNSVKNDLRVWYPKVKVGGIFCGHDYLILEKEDEVAKAVVEFALDKGLELHVEGWDWYIIKNGLEDSIWLP